MSARKRRCCQGSESTHVVACPASPRRIGQNSIAGFYICRQVFKRHKSVPAGEPHGGSDSDRRETDVSGRRLTTVPAIRGQRLRPAG